MSGRAAAREAAPARGRITVRRGSLHYVRTGTGPETVLIHGLASDLAFWYLGIVPLLARRFTVTAFDLPGHGYSDMPTARSTSADLAADTLELMDRLEIERAHLVGHSFGGSVALHAAVLRPDRVASLVLADARVNALQARLPARDDGRWQSVHRRIEDLGVELPERLPAVAYSVLEELLDARRPLSGDELRSAARLFGAGPAAGRKLARWLRLMETTGAGADYRAVAGLTIESLEAIRTPVLAVYGERSSCLPTGRGLERHLPGLALVIEPGLGHLHPFLAPERLHGHMVRFLDRPEVAA